MGRKSAILTTGPYSAISAYGAIWTSTASAPGRRRCCALSESPGTSRGRPSLCTSVTVIGLLLAAPNYRKKMEKTADATAIQRRGREYRAHCLPTLSRLTGSAGQHSGK
eukprot:scaffold16305_cov124-Isochrysis_galbana.AAC.1